MVQQEGLEVASIARDDPSTLPSDDPFPRARMHHDRQIFATYFCLISFKYLKKTSTNAKDLIKPVYACTS